MNAVPEGATRRIQRIKNRKLDLSRKGLTSLPPLPPGLIELNLATNNLTSITSLPESLEVLNINNNPNLSTLPELPLNLKVFSCNSCKIYHLPMLPVGLKSLDCRNNPLMTFKELPESLETLEINAESVSRMNPRVGAFVTTFIYSENLDELRNSLRKFYNKMFAPRIADTPENEDIPESIYTYLYNYITTMTETQQFMLSQYSEHGDVILNGMLRGIDTIAMYQDNILESQFAADLAKEEQISCLYFYLLAPQFAENRLLKATKPGIRRRSYYMMDTYLPASTGMMNRWNPEYRNNRQTIPVTEFRKFKSNMVSAYINEVYPQLESHFENTPENLEYFRRLTYEAFKIIFYTIQNTVSTIPVSVRNGNGFVVYRGVKSFHIPGADDTIVINSFISTSADWEIAEGFYENSAESGGIYKFIVAPTTPCMYMEPLTYHDKEYEFLLPPGVRFTFLGIYLDGDIKTPFYLVLPPRSDQTVGTRIPDTYEEYMEWASGLEWALQPMNSFSNPYYTDIDDADELIAQSIREIAIRVGHEGGGKTRRRRRTRGGRVQLLKPMIVQSKFNKIVSTANTRKKLASMRPNNRVNKKRAMKPAVPIASGTRWDSLPVQYMKASLNEKEAVFVQELKSKIKRSR